MHHRRRNRRRRLDSGASAAVVAASLALFGPTFALSRGPVLHTACGTGSVANGTSAVIPSLWLNSPFEGEVRGNGRNPRLLQQRGRDDRDGRSRCKQWRRGHLGLRSESHRARIAKRHGLGIGAEPSLHSTVPRGSRRRRLGRQCRVRIDRARQHSGSERAVDRLPSGFERYFRELPRRTELRDCLHVRRARGVPGGRFIPPESGSSSGGRR